MKTVAALTLAAIFAFAPVASAEEPITSQAQRLAVEHAANAQLTTATATRQSSKRVLAGVGLIMAGTFALTYQHFNCDGYGFSNGKADDGLGNWLCHSYERQMSDDASTHQTARYAAIGAIGLGTLLTTVWADVPVDVRADHNGFKVGRRIGW